MQKSCNTFFSQCCEVLSLLSQQCCEVLYRDLWAKLRIKLPHSESRVVTKIFVFVISRKFREILISCFAKFSSSLAKFSRNTKSKLDEISVISRNFLTKFSWFRETSTNFLLKFNKILIITPYLVDMSSLFKHCLVCQSGMSPLGWSRKFSFS